MKKKITILGSTGSIGVNALDVISKNSADYEVVGLAAGRNIALLREQIRRFRPSVVSVLREEDARELGGLLGPDNPIEILWGLKGYRELAAGKESRMIISAMVGSSGLLPTWEAILAGKDIALANKETLVMAGRLIMEKAAERGVRILPVDSEHSAVFQCLEGQQRNFLKRIILTASGGPFLYRPKQEFEEIHAEDALRHPNWKMGKKITIDSASMMNKGLEVIEARWLFGVDFDRIDVMIHPQSIIHSMVEFRDGSILAQMGIPDMRVPISYALSYPERAELPSCRLDLLRAGRLEFMEPDMEKFPNLRLAYEAGKFGEGMPAVLNAANEVAVEKFLEGRIGFTDMTVLIKKTMAEYNQKRSLSMDEILEVDRWARVRANLIFQGMEHES
jgi:1-deoxy-D-xylulose-5-phosphate reductoisomerase